MSIDINWAPLKVAVLDRVALAVPASAIELVRRLRQRGLEITICTPLPKHEVETVLAAAQIEDQVAQPSRWVCDCFTGTFGELPHLHRIAEYFGVTLAEILYVNSHWEDVVAAAKSDATVVYYWDEPPAADGRMPDNLHRVTSRELPYAF